MARKFNISLLIPSILLFYGAGCQDTGRFAVTGKVSTLGLGGELTTAITPKVNARVGVNALQLNVDENKVEDVEYDTELDFSSLSVLADWHVFDDAFRISGGVLSMNNGIEMNARPTVSVEIGDNIYTPAQVGTLTGRVDIDGLAPYIGIGWGNPLTSRQRWGFACDFGLAFTDSPEVSLTSTGVVSQADLTKEIKEIEDDADSFKVYPVISLGFYYRF
jgi:hypothetical protein